MIRKRECLINIDERMNGGQTDRQSEQGRQTDRQTGSNVERLWFVKY